jgi:site-specific DNA-methyltransferase (adenine-specific)
MKPYEIHMADSKELLATFPENSFDAVVTDPPYHLQSIVDRFGGKGAAPAQHGTDGAFARASKGFMNETWDGGDIAFQVDFWREVIRVLKPGGHMLAFSGSRTYHRMACAIEDSGFDIRDQVFYCYGTGFPKSKSMTGDWKGWGSALKPAHEPIVLARKPFKGSMQNNLETHGTGALNIDGCRIGEEGRFPANLIHDGVMGEVGKFFYCAKASRADKEEGLDDLETVKLGFSDGAQASMKNETDYDKAQTIGYNRIVEVKNIHPTVKPTDLMRYLCRLITPPNGRILDPFMGSGSTGKAAMLEGFQFTGIDMTEKYIEIAQRRIDHAWRERNMIFENEKLNQMELFA